MTHASERMLRIMRLVYCSSAARVALVHGRLGSGSRRDTRGACLASLHFGRIVPGRATLTRFDLRALIWSDTDRALTGFSITVRPSGRVLIEARPILMR